MAKQQRKATYQARLDRVVDHIYRHLDEDVRPEGLAEIACLSPYHWHRIYVAMRGETVSATIRRLRLLRAADRLANSDCPSVRSRSGRATAAPTPSGASFVRHLARPGPPIASRAAMRRSRPPRKPRTTPDFPSRSRPFRPRAALASLHTGTLYADRSSDGTPLHGARGAGNNGAGSGDVRRVLR